MEFAEWVVSGLDQLRLGQLPAGNDFYNAASSGLGGDARLAAYMNSGEAEARAELVQLVADAVAANPEFEQQLRTAAEAAQPQGAAGGKEPFLKTTNGMLVLIAAAVLVVGGGIGLAVGLGGSGGGNLQAMLKGTWTCQASGLGSDDAGDALSLTIGDGTFKAGGTSGTFTQNGKTATLHNSDEPDNDLKVTGLPSGAGSFNVTMQAADDTSGSEQVHVTGTVSAHKIVLALPADLTGGNVKVTCTK